MRLFRIVLLTVCFHLVGGQIQATQRQPWLGNFGEFEWRNSFLYQGYPAISSGSDVKKYSVTSLFLTSSLAVSLTDSALEFEVTQASSRRQTGNIDNVKVSGRYRWMDDIAGDFISFASGAVFDYAFPSAVRDISSFHHGCLEGEFYLSIGKETADGLNWSYRWWAVAAIGAAEMGSPWLRFDPAFEWRICEKHEFKAFAQTLWGLGRKKLECYHFKNYGSIHHQSVDLGLRYTYALDYFGTASLEYSYRIFARNFPVYTHRITAEILYTFGL